MVVVPVTDTPTVERINQLLSEVYTEEGIKIWWQSPNRNLHGLRPDRIFQGDTMFTAFAVLHEAERVAGC